MFAISTPRILGPQPSVVLLCGNADVGPPGEFAHVLHYGRRIFDAWPAAQKAVNRNRLAD